MKVIIPPELKADVPQTTWGKVFAATPVAMAVVATMLAGLASSEMTRAQYSRAFAAQQQSKAGDQWSFFQAKRLRGAVQHNTVDLLRNTTELHAFDPAVLRSLPEQLPAQVAQNEAPQAQAAKVKSEMVGILESGAGQQALAFLQKGEVPSVGVGPTLDPAIKAVLDAIDSIKPEQEVALLLTHVTEKALEEAILAARNKAQDFDTATKPINQAIDQLDNLLTRQAALVGQRLGGDASGGIGGGRGPSLNRDFTVARLNYAAQRYEVEARLNQGIANLYELQVRKSNMTAERHHARSQRFFFGMLGAQLGVIISTFAMAARKRNLLWALAAGAGLLAIAFAIYVYLCV